MSTRLLQRPTNAQAGPDAVVAGWVESVAIYCRQRPDLGAGAGRRRGHRRSVAALRRDGQGPQLPGQLRRLRRAAALRRCADARRRPADPAGRRQRRQHGRCRRGAARARRHGIVDGGDARARLGPRLRVRRPERPAARRRHARRDGGVAHAGAAAPARRRAAHLRLRPDVGLRRDVHEPGGPAGAPRARPRGSPGSRARAIPAADEGARLRAARAGPGGRRAGDGDLRLPGAGRWACSSPCWRWRSIRSTS